MIKTERLNIRVASDDEMRVLISQQTIEELKIAYGEMLASCQANPEQRQWYAAWFIELPTGERIGELCFKGVSADGSVEIGYGISPEFWGRGFATEAVKAVTEWALSEPNVNRITAETEEDNIASQRVLEKSGFVPTGKNGEEGPLFVKVTEERLKL